MIPILQKDTDMVTDTDMAMELRLKKNLFGNVFLNSFGFVAQSLTKFYTELHRGFLLLDCVERDA